MLSRMRYLVWLIMIRFLIGTYGCTPSSCGNIHNISYPFRLKGDKKHWGKHEFELVCENDDTASFFFLSQKYIVQSINYSIFSISLTDASVSSNDECSFPNRSLSYRDFSDNKLITYDTLGVSMLTVMSCPYPVNNSLFLDISTTCVGTRYTYKYNYINYMEVGKLTGSYLKEMCKIEVMTLTTSLLNQEKGISLSEIHSSLLHGFQLSWMNALCDRNCFRCSLTSPDATQPICLEYERRHCYFGFWDIACAGNRMRSLWSSKAEIGITQVIEVAIEYGGPLYLALRFIIGLPCVAVFLICTLRRRHFSAFNIIEAFLQNNNNLVPIRYSYSDIKKITRNFREELGKGGYGSVYKGKLRSGHEVAVKMLCMTKENGQDFINEVATIGRIHHVNVVKLVGYCVEGSKRALIYDLMPNGSLEKYIFYHDHEMRSNSLSWERKYKIAVGVARGIEYLHKGCDVQILHFDIKPHNILLDEDFTPKISDFGLAKSFSVEKNVVTLTAARGTIGYVAPEIINRSIGEVSDKADVYSFGMLLMEMVGLNRDKAPDDENSSQYFPYWIYDRINKGKEIQTGNIDDGGDIECARKIKQMTVVGLWCIQMNPNDRPSMSEALKMLEGGDENLQVPPLLESSRNECSNDEIWDIESTESVAILSCDALSIEQV